MEKAALYPTPTARKSPLAPRLLLAGLLAVLVFGACGTANILREDAARQPLVLRHHVQWQRLLFGKMFYDTVSTDLLYRGEVLMPSAPECEPPAAVPPGQPTQRLHIRRVRALAGPEPRWVFELVCPDDRNSSLYLLRLPPGGPSFHRIGAWHDGWRRNARAAMIPLTDTLTYFVDTEGGGTLFDWQRLEGTPVVLANLAALRWQSKGANVAYSLSPDRRSMARVYRETQAAAPIAPGTSPTQATQSAVRLTIDTYDLDQHTTRRLLLDSLHLPPIELPRLTQWTQTAGRWELLPRP